MAIGGHSRDLLPCGRAQEGEVLLQARPHAQVQDPQQLCRRGEAAGVLPRLPAPHGCAAASLGRALLTLQPAGMRARLQGCARVVPVQASVDWP